MANNHHYLFTDEDIIPINKEDNESFAVTCLAQFKEKNFSCKIVTRNYNPYLHQTLKRKGISSAEVINIYDFIQGTSNVVRKENPLRFSSLVDKKNYKIDGVDANHSYITFHDKKVARVDFMPLTYGEVGVVSYYDNFNNISSKDIYDYRGFKSKTQYMHPDGSIGHEVVYNLNQEPVMDITHMNINGHLLPTMYKLLGYNGGKDIRFNTENEMFAFILNEICTQYERPIIMDENDALKETLQTVDKAEQLFTY